MRTRKPPVSMKAGTYPAELRKMTVGGKFLTISIEMNPKPKPTRIPEKPFLIQNLEAIDPARDPRAAKQAMRSAAETLKKIYGHS